jgi:glycosyltransferase involved in cell wall biosynthesis
VLFAINNLQVGGAEMLTFELLNRLDRARFAPELACMREAGELGEQLTAIPVHTHVLSHKYDFRAVWKIARLLRAGRFDALVTVGAGDRMFYGRLAAALARTPVVVSALHSTGWPDVINLPNRLLTPLTTAFVGCAEPHARYLIEVEKLPASRVHWIPNGVDTDKFRPRAEHADPPAAARFDLRAELGFAASRKLIGIVAQLRPEKNHELLLQAFARVVAALPESALVIIGGGPRMAELTALAAELGLAADVKFLGPRGDVPRLLPQLDLFVLCSKIEANPVSILEAQACGLPVVSTRVGSIPETVRDSQTGLLVGPGDSAALGNALVRLLADDALRHRFGTAARANVVANWSLARMVRGYEELLTRLRAEQG